MGAATRKLPNCFNFLRQLEILGRAGHDGSASAFTAHSVEKKGGPDEGGLDVD